MAVNIYLQDSDLISFGCINPEVGLLDHSVQSLSCVQLFVTPWTAACQALLSVINSNVKMLSCIIPSNLNDVLESPPPQMSFPYVLNNLQNAYPIQRLILCISYVQLLSCV